MYPLICSPDGETEDSLRSFAPRFAMPFFHTRQKGIELTCRATRALLFSFSILYQATIYFPCPLPRYFSALRTRRNGGISWPSTKGFFHVCVSSLPLADLRLLIRRSLVDLVRQEFQHGERENRAFLGL